MSSAPRWETGPAAPGEDTTAQRILETLPAAVYVTDAAGRITFYNAAAAKLWGAEPEPGSSDLSWQLYWPDGRPMAYRESPMAVALRERRPLPGVEAAAARPDGTRVSFFAFSTPLFDAGGALTGAVNLLVELSPHRLADQAEQRLAAIVAFSDDAILAKNLDGTITDWNRGAERLYGYTAEEAIGKPVAMLIPLDRPDEEPQILARIGRGERIDHYETIRRRKDGSLVEISLSVSPLRDREGRIIGAAKIARDITERRRAEQQQGMLLREMDHRLKNMFSLAGSLVTISARTAATPAELAASVRARLVALAQAQSLTMTKSPAIVSAAGEATTLHALIRTIFAPYESGADGPVPRMTITGCDVSIGGSAITSFALLLHEFATNAAKYGALSGADGRVDIVCSDEDDRLVLTWTEIGGPAIEGPRGEAGFGTLLTKATLQGQLEGEIAYDWRREGLSIRLSVARNRLCP